MDKSVISTIEKIKLQEQDNEAKLKEKRELETTTAALNRSIKDISMQAEKKYQDYLELLTTTDSLSAKLEIEKLRKIAMSAQIEDCKSQLKELQSKSDQGISKVWGLRSSLCESVQSISDECDVWALLMKPISSEPFQKNCNIFTNKVIELANEQKLKKAVERRNQVLAERNRLLSEPDNGEEFLRIKSALRYSLEKSVNMRK